MDKKRMDYINDFKKKNYKRYTLEIKKEEYEALIEQAEKKGLTLKDFIKKACDSFSDTAVFYIDTAEEERGKAER